MSVLKSMGAESLFGDVQRMDKRQVMPIKTYYNLAKGHESHFCRRITNFCSFSTKS
jgi:hypothetical protein